MFIFTPNPGEMIQFDSYFSNGLVQPPDKQRVLNLSEALQLEFARYYWLPPEGRQLKTEQTKVVLRGTLTIKSPWAKPYKVGPTKNQL